MKPIDPQIPEEIRQFLSRVLQEDQIPRQASAAIYTRLSRIQQNGYGYSLEFQPEKLMEYARQQGLNVYRIYEDAGATGRNSKRKAFQQMREDIIAGHVQVVLIHRLDRIFRNLESLLGFIRLIRQYNVRLISHGDAIDLETPMGRLLLSVLGAWAEMPVWQASIYGREAKLKRILSGLPNANYIYGYCNGVCSACTDPNGKDYCPRFGMPDRPENHRGRVLVPHPVEAECVRWIVEQYNHGMSDREIANAINTNTFVQEDGLALSFRTKGRPGSVPPAQIGRDNVREIVINPFYVGMVAHYPTRPLSMDDNIHQPEQVKKAALRDKRAPQVLVAGQHEALYPYELWKSNQQLRKSKGKTPVTNTGKPVHQYLLSGCGFCWECWAWQASGKLVSLRGTQGGSGNRYYRCSTLHEKYIVRRKSKKPCNAAGLTAQPVAPELLERHGPHLRMELLDDQVVQLLEKMIIPREWYDWIVAFFISEQGMPYFERETYNLTVQLERLRTMYLNGHLDEADFHSRSLDIRRELDVLRPSARPEAGEILPLLENLPLLWKQMIDHERRALVRIMFRALLFDREGRLRHVMAHAPFDRWVE
jgi:hypothetical protein